MNISKTISDISLYLEVYPVKETSNYNCANFSILPNPSFSNEIGVCVIDGNGKKIDDIQLAESILEHCSEENLDEMIAEYGEESAIGQLIRRRRAEKYQRSLLDNINVIEDKIEESLIHSIKTGNPFYETVCRYIDEKGYKSDADFYNSIGMPRQLFARIRNSEANLSKKTVLWIIIGLKLNYSEARELLLLSGYSLKKNDKKDVIISYILRHTQYSLFKVNEILDHFGEDSFC